jgi:hypothetical protein
MYSYFAAAGFKKLTRTQTSRSAKSSRRISNTSIEGVGRDELNVLWTQTDMKT